MSKVYMYDEELVAVFAEKKRPVPTNKVINKASRRTKRSENS
jgi:hypothetical protein